MRTMKLMSMDEHSQSSVAKQLHWANIRTPNISDKANWMKDLLSGH